MSETTKTDIQTLSSPSAKGSLDLLIVRAKLYKALYQKELDHILDQDIEQGSLHSLTQKDMVISVLKAKIEVIDAVLFNYDK